MTNNFTPAKAGQQSKRLSKEEYAEKMKVEKEAVYQMADDTAKAIVSDPEKFKAFLDTQSRLDRYSAVNALLIFKQLPEASQLKNFDDWSKDNVKIQKGAKSISILEPVEYAKRDGTTGISYNVKKVFDVSQTNGKRPPAPTVNRDPKALITVMLDSSPVEVEATNELPYPNMAAFYNNEEQTLYVKRDVGDSVAVAQCVAQELGHAQLSINSDSYSRANMGFQAVCISFDTLTDRQTYEVIAVFKTVVYTDSPDSFKYYHFVNAETDEDFTAYVEKCKELSLYDIGVTAEYGDKLLTLSTCEYSRTNGRLVVVAKLINE